MLLASLPFPEQPFLIRELEIPYSPTRVGGLDLMCKSKATLKDDDDDEEPGGRNEDDAD